MVFVPGLRVVEEPADRAAGRAGVPLHRVPHWHLGRLLRAGLWGAPAVPAPLLTQRGLEGAMRKRTGLYWIAYGHRMSDGISRYFYLRRRGVIDYSARRLAPIFDWKGDDVRRYLVGKDIVPPSCTFGLSNRVRGAEFDLSNPACLRWLRTHHPEDWTVLTRAYPDMEALLDRHPTRECSGTDAGTLQPQDHS
jgi:phosphoadenosine phosphosulfate reductase